MTLTLPQKRPFTALPNRDGGIDPRQMLIGLLIGFIALPAVVLWFFVIQPEIEKPRFEYEADAEAAEVEARYMLDHARKAVQAAAARSNAPLALVGDDGCGLEAKALTGQHYVLVNGVGVSATGEFELAAVPLAGDYPVLRMRFLPTGEFGEILEEPHPER